MTIAQNFPNLKPSLLLDFENSNTLDPRVTFSRASAATYYDGQTTAKAEENLLIRSQEFNTWSTTGTSVVDGALAPDGTATAQSLDDGSSTNVHARWRANVVAASTTYAFSVFAKDVDRRYVGLAINNASGTYATVEFDLSGSGSVNRTEVAGTGFSVVSSAITSVGGGWFRCQAIITTGSGTVSEGRATIYMSDGTTAFDSRGRVTYTGSDKTVQIWGAQLEQRSSVTAYTPTTTQPITNYIPVLQTAASGVARFDHNPVTGESLGLLIEEQRTNLLARSEEFDDGAWGKNRINVTANIVVAPDGTLTSDEIIPNTEFGFHTLNSVSIAYGASQTVCGSVYFKANGYSRLRVRLGQSSGFLADVVADASTGTLIGGNIANATIIPVGNGWYRFSVFGITGSPNTAVGYQLWVYDNSAGIGQAEFTGDGYSGIYIWGAQLEAGAFPTSYIPTVASQVTRIADVASMTGTNFSSWYRADEGTMYADYTIRAALPASTFGAVFGIKIDSSTRLVFLYNPFTTNNAGFYVINNNTVQASIGFNLNPNTDFKIAGAYKLNDFAAAPNGNTVVVDSLGTVPIGIAADIGSNNGSVRGVQHIRKLAFYPKRLSDTELQSLTTP